MATPAEFAAQCKATARLIRRLPPELRRELGRQVKPKVADPLAASVRADWVGPHRAVLSAGTKTRVAGDPQLVVGGARRVLSGGGSVRSVVFGDEFGGGSRRIVVSSTSRRRAHRRHTTRQFARAGYGRLFGTVRNQLEPTFDRWASIVDDVLRGITSGN
jgi:hypothetical protein